MKQHTVLDLPPEYPGGEPGRRCCVCHLSEQLCGKFPECAGKPRFSVNPADQKEMGRARKRKKRR